jgi:hypothetical protein
LLHVLGRSAKADARGRIFAVLSTQVLTVGLRLQHRMLARGSILEVSRDDVAAREEQLVSCAAEKRKYCFICTVSNPWPLRKFSFREQGSFVVFSRRC